ncbi:MAG: hypothetical protein ACK4UJ_10775 [Leptonema sp. (in: bacteria)]
MNINIDIENLIQQIKESGKYGEIPVFTPEQIKEFEEKLQFSFPEEYKTLVTKLEPDIANFYFVLPYPYTLNPDFIIFAEWTNDVFAFHKKDSKIYTILKDNQNGMQWKDFLHWFRYIWEMSAKPINPE